MSIPEELELRRAKARAYRQKRATHYAALNRNWILNNRDAYNASKARYRLKLKIEVMRLYADPVQCVQCNFDNIDGLCLDHIENNGAQHRREAGLSTRGAAAAGMRIYEYIRKNGKIDGLQVLCANCNLIKQLRHLRKRTIKDPAILAEIERLYADRSYS